MSLRNTIATVTKLAQTGAIRQYAITGAVAALNYIQPTLTEDLDILVSVSHLEERPSGLILLAPIEAALAKMGYTERSELGYIIGEWPVQFIPVASALDQEALEKAVDVEIRLRGDPPLKARGLTAEHLVAIAIRVGRLKDLARVQAFLDQEALDLAALDDILKRHNLMKEWLAFCAKAGITNPLTRT